ncbi:tyrosine-type recombinase/integrase [Nocardia sp. NPDC051570]|uniref:tyrosine-type recombinase/integrase n=1 Tax=Nocardia sp. NPDC051570 TaxID=3364324 RepID=UPI0037881CFE
MAGLRWEDVDLKAKTIRIVENRVAVGKEIMTGTPKSKRSRRVLPMPDSLVDVLKAAGKRQREEKIRPGGAYNGGDYVACDEAGRPYRPNLLTFRWKKLLKELGIVYVWLHDARHSCASLMHSKHVHRDYCGVAGACLCHVHDGGVHAQRVRSVEGRGHEFRSRCDNP